MLRPGGYFVWSATPVYQKLEEDVEIWDGRLLPYLLLLDSETEFSVSVLTNYSFVEIDCSHD